MTDDSSIVGLEIENIAKAVKRTNQSNSQIQNNSRSLDDSSKSEIKSKIEELNDKVNTLDFDKETQPPKIFGGTLSKLNTLNFEDTSPIFKIKGRETPTPSVIEECRYTIMKMLDEPVSGRNFPLKNQNLNTSLTHKEGSKTTKNANSNAKSAFNYFNNVNSTTKNDNNNNTESPINSKYELIPPKLSIISVEVLREQPIENISENPMNRSMKYTALNALDIYMKNNFPEKTNYWLEPLVYITKPSIENDSSLWKVIKFQLKTKHDSNNCGYNILFFYLRRLFIPPLYESYNDFIIILHPC